VNGFDSPETMKKIQKQATVNKPSIEDRDNDNVSLSQDLTSETWGFISWECEVASPSTSSDGLITSLLPYCAPSASASCS
jgi:hypothetical protein